MKICPSCHHENEDEAVFCEQCGQKLTEPATESLQKEEAEPRHMTQTHEKLNLEPETEELTRPSDPVPQRHQPTPPNKQQRTWLIVAIIVVIGILLGIILFLVLRDPSPAPKETVATTQTSAQADKENEELKEYDAVIAEAKKLTIDGKYKESELKLAEIPVSALGKEEFASIKEAIDNLTSQNNAGLKDQKSQDQSSQDQSNPNSTFVGDYAKWASTYTFYYQQSGQKQTYLTIGANGSAKQNNSNGTQYFGQASITGASGDILSYNTDALYPTSLPDTKMIHPDVKITIQWDNGGGTQIFYGYLSYSSRLVLTDGAAKGSGVNEVWITY